MLSPNLLQSQIPMSGGEGGGGGVGGNQFPKVNFKFFKPSPELKFPFCGWGGGGWGWQSTSTKCNFKISKSNPELKFPFPGEGEGGRVEGGREGGTWNAWNFYAAT